MPTCSCPFEAQIVAAIARSQPAEGTSIVIQRYGNEILGFLVDRVGLTDAEDVFASFAERVYRSILTYRGDGAIRAWSYRVARSALVDHFRALKRDRWLQPLDTVAAEKIAAHVRTTTANFQRTTTKTRLQALRERLPDEDQCILILRVDRNLSWNEVAEAMLEEGVQPSAEALKSEAARLRKRFGRAKEQLRAMAEAEGLFDSSS